MIIVDVLKFLYGMIIKSTLDGRTRNGSGDVQRIMKTLPFLTSNDKVKVSKSIAALSDVTGRIIKEKEGMMSTTGSNAVSVFLESIQEYYGDYLATPGMEGDNEVFIKTGRSGLPTFITVECLVKNGNKLEKKKMQIGIRCIAKTITKEETVAFFVKHKNSVAEVKTANTLWQKVKNVVTLSFLRNKNSQSDTSPAVVKTLESKCLRTFSFITSAALSVVQDKFTATKFDLSAKNCMSFGISLNPNK